MKRADLKHLWVLMATVFVDMIGFLMVLPLLPFYAEDLGADPVIVTLLVAAFSVAQLLTSPFWGRFSDSLGRRPMIVLGLLVSAVAFVLFAVASSMVRETAGHPEEPLTLGLGLLFLSRLIQGVGGGTTGVVQAYVSDVVPREDRAKALGWLSAATSAGVTLGPAFGSLAARWGDAAPGALAATLCLLNAAFAWHYLTEPGERRKTKEEKRQALEQSRADKLSGRSAEKGTGKAGGERQPIIDSILHVLAHPGRTIHSLIFIYALGMMAFMAMNSILALFLERRFGVTEETIGWFYVFVGGLSFIMRAAILGPVVSRLGEVRTLRLGAVSLGLGLAAISFTGDLSVATPWNYLILAAAIAFVPIGTALLFPATTSQISGRAREGETGQTLGVQQAFGGIARVVGPVWAGFAFRDWGVPTPFWIGAALMGCVVLLSLRIRPLGRDPDERRAGTTEAEAGEVEVS